MKLKIINSKTNKELTIPNIVSVKASYRFGFGSACSFQTFFVTVSNQSQFELNLPILDNFKVDVLDGLLTIRPPDHDIDFEYQVIAENDELINFKDSAHDNYEKNDFTYFSFWNSIKFPKTNLELKLGNLLARSYIMGIYAWEQFQWVKEDFGYYYILAPPSDTDRSYTISLSVSKYLNPKGKTVNQDFFEKHPRQKDISGALYCLYMSSPNESFYKIGITRHWKKETLEAIRQLYYGEQTNYNVKLVGWIEDMSFHEAWIQEQKLLKEYKQYKPIHKFEGSTECLAQKPSIFKN